MVSKALRFLLLLGILTYLTIPVIDFCLNPPQGPTLQGSYTVYEKPSWSIKRWLSGDFQFQFDHYFNQQFRYQAFFIELDNQFYFSCFKEANANGAVIGKDNYLYEAWYIHAFLGKDFLGKKKIDEKIRQLINIQDYLKKQNTDLILVLAPNKARFYPEYFPAPYRSDTMSPSNFNYFSSQLKESTIHYIDFDSWMLSLKTNKTLQPHEKLFTKYGTHWSEYSGLMATDSLLRYITRLKGLPPFSLVIDSLTHTHKERGTDNDISGGLNLLCHPPEADYWYPSYHITTDSSLSRLSILGVGDSFYWNTFYFLQKENLAKKNAFWYFNKEVYPESFTQKTPVDTTKISKDLKSYDVVVFIVAEPNLVKLPFKMDEHLH